MEKEAILCVDDEVIILMALVQEIKLSFGNRYIYIRATNADDALSSIDEMNRDGIKVKLIISDLIMPGMKGDEFLEIATNRYDGIKSIMITGLAEPEAIERINRNKSVMGILKKPWQHTDLKNLMDQALGA